MEEADQQHPTDDVGHVNFETDSFAGDDLKDLGLDLENGEDLLDTFLKQQEFDENHAIRTETPQNIHPDHPYVPDMNPSTSASSKKEAASPTKKSSLRRSKRKNRKPRRPLCGYNIFFQKHSKEIQPTTAFKDLGRIMGERWKRLSEEERAVYEKEAEKDVIRFRREMDLFERQRKALISPPLPSTTQTTMHTPSATDHSASTSSPVPATLNPPPGWSAVSIPGNNIKSQHTGTTPGFFPMNHGPPALPTTGLHVPGQYVGPPPPTMALPQGSFVSLPDYTGVARKYKVVYACYRMTQGEANDYMARFAALTAGSHHSVAHPAASPIPQGPNPSHNYAAQVSAGHPPPSPQVSRQLVTHNSPPTSPQVVRTPYVHAPPQVHTPHSPRISRPPLPAHSSSHPTTTQAPPSPRTAPSPFPQTVPAQGDAGSAPSWHN